MNDEYSISDITIVTPKELLDNASIRISDGKIKDFSKSEVKDYSIKGAYILFPALINAHDHLFGSCGSTRRPLNSARSPHSCATAVR